MMSAIFKVLWAKTVRAFRIWKLRRSIKRLVRDCRKGLDMLSDAHQAVKLR